MYINVTVVPLVFNVSLQLLHELHFYTCVLLIEYKIYIIKMFKRQLKESIANNTLYDAYCTNDKVRNMNTNSIFLHICTRMM